MGSVSFLLVNMFFEFEKLIRFGRYLAVLLSIGDVMFDLAYAMPIYIDFFTSSTQV